jgi:PAS domain S-box-containing protein
VLNRHGHVERLNPAMERLLGYPSEAWKGAPFGYFAFPDEGHALRQRVGEIIAGARPSAQLEQRFRRRDRSILIGRVSLSAITTDRGEPIGVAVTCEDITEGREAQRALYLREAHFRDLFDSVPVALFQVALDGRILALNPAMRDLVGAAPGDLTGELTLAGLCADTTAERETLALHRACDIVPRRTNTTFRGSGGRPLPVELSMRAVTNARGEVAYYEATVQPIGHAVHASAASYASR